MLYEVITIKNRFIQGGFFMSSNKMMQLFQTQLILPQNQNFVHLQPGEITGEISPFHFLSYIFLKRKISCC